MRSALVDRLLKAAGARAADAERGWGATGAYGQRYSPESRKEFVEAYRDRVWTHRCIDLIGSSATQVPMQVRRGKEWTEEHPLLDLLRRPSPRDPALMFFEWSIKWAETVGDWFWEIVPSQLGTIAQLYPLRSHLVEIKPGEGGTIAGYVYDPNENSVNVIQYQAVDPDNPQVRGNADEPMVVAGRYASPLDDLYGMSPLRAAKDDIVSEYFGVRYDHRFFRNAARPDLMLAFKKGLDATSRKENKEEWESFKGVDNSHRAALMSGDVEATVLTQTQKDVEYLEGRRLSREGQCAAFGVPPVLVGDMTRATYSNFENAEPIFWKITMLPKLEFFATWCNFVLLPFYPDIEEFRFDVSRVPALARAEGWRSERARAEVAGGVLTPNEAREDLDLEPVEEEGADLLWLPTRVRPITDLAESAPVPELKPDTGKEAEATAKGEKAFALEEKTTVEAWLRKALEAKLRYTGVARTSIVQHFSGQRDRIMEIVEGQEKAADLEALLRDYGWSEDDKNFREAVEAMQAGLAEASFKLTTETIDHTPSEGLIEKVLKELGNRKDGIGSVSGRVKDEVIEQVREGLSHGLTFRQIAEGGTFTSGVAGEGDVTIKGVSGVYEEYRTWQAERIARTEAAVTFNRSSAALMRDGGITHVDIADGDEDEDCALANGSRWTLAEYEANPISHPNCTRIGLPVLEALEPS